MNTKNNLKIPKFPQNLTERKINKYLNERVKLGDTDFTINSLEIKRFVMAFHHLFSHSKISIPINLNNAKINKIIGLTETSFTNLSGNIWYGLYRGFVVNSSNKNEKIWVGINYRKKYVENNQLGDLAGLNILVGVQSEEITHHSLQLSMRGENYNFDSERELWKISHNGVMASGKNYGVKISEVLSAVKESGAEHLIRVKNGKERVYLGKLYHPKKSAAKNVNRLVNNILLYGYIRHNLRLNKRKNSYQLK